MSVAGCANADAGVRTTGNAVTKRRILAYCDAPTASTGFGNASRHILGLLHATGRYDIDVIGVNSLGNPHTLPFRIWPAMPPGSSDPFGHKHAPALISTLEFDLLFFFQDSYQFSFVPELLVRLRQERQRPFRTIGYYPVDSILTPEWAANLAPMDYLACYAEFARELSLKQLPERKDIRVIPHGIDPGEFHPIADRARVAAFRRDYFHDQAASFIVTNVNRNQHRKDIPRTIRAFKRFHEQVPDSVLYLHMHRRDVTGWDLPAVCRQLDLTVGRDVHIPEHFNTFTGIDRETLNLIYNASDVVVSTSLGEGFGFSWAEAMAAGTPVIMPRNTAMAEFITEDTGYLVDSGSNDSLWTVLTEDGGIPRPLADVDRLVATLHRVKTNPREAAAKADAAHHWITAELDWRGSIREQWVALFGEAEAALERERTTAKSDLGVIDAIRI